ncbi:TonB-linked SusC/RagA family outer membrane protein [Pedobacter africanus]|uniref:TonB-linked SusC/RagA family outer membrane protein n=1 Tax=Pedobacter africanus TaxID=151894 RepID=A0ACC6KSR4_9SPHI|nr:TonB-dependent receptor [Pedobacter africanus]MDR6782299.1 TonB-linked SusC/RagA family outer membrane protein [Pedobacter africanus]
MRLTTVILIAALMQVSAAGLAQKITISKKQADLRIVLKVLRIQSGYNFVYADNVLAQAKPVDIAVKAADFKDVLAQIFANQPLTYKIDNNVVIVQLKPAALTQTDRKNIRVSGVVTDETGNPLPGAGVRMKGGDKKAVADKEGRYNIEVPENAILVFTYLGFDDQEVRVEGRQTINVTLKSQVSKLDEVLVVGYGSVRKVDITGSVAQVNIRDMAKAPVSSIEQALAGRVAGLNVSASQGQPGEEGVNIRIRGVGSITQDASPLFVIDGFATENFDLSMLNPDDIASINVLKDASGTAIYGSRGANGVIVIETKKGSVSKPNLNYSGSYGFQDVTKRVEVLSPYEFVKLEFERDSVTAKTLYLPEGVTYDSYKNLAGINWQDQFFRQGVTNMHNLSLRGGNKDTRYAVSGSLFETGSVVVNTGLRKQQGRVTLDQNVSSKLKAGVSANYTHTQTYGQIASSIKDGYASSALLYSVWGYRPVNARYLTGDIDLEEELFDEDVTSTTDYRFNPVESAKNVYRNKDNNNLVANGYFSYDITKNLVFKSTGAINLNTIQLGTFYNSRTSEGSPVSPRNNYGQWGAMVYSSRNTWSNENTLTYSKLNKNNSLTVLGGFSFQKESNKGNNYTAIKVPNETLGIDGLGQGTPLAVGSFGTYNTLQSYFTRLNYGYRNRYLFTATFRADGSSKFPNNKWGYFPSAAFAWKMKEESFLKGIEAITEAKLRLSYGLTGNNRVGDFSALSPISVENTTGYSFGNEVPTPAAIPTIGNPELRWETTAQLNLGYDLSLLKNRIEVVVDVYRKKTDNLLLLANMSPSTGYARAYKNVGKLKNDGLEFTLNTVNINKRNFSWRSNFNISFNRNTILQLADQEERLLSAISPRWQSGYADPVLYSAAIGHAVGNFVGYIFDGIYQYEDFYRLPNGGYRLKNSVSTNGMAREVIKPGYIRYKDLNNDGIITAADQTIIGRGLPVHSGGFSNNFTYKNLSLNVFLQWSYGNDVYNANKLIFEAKAYSMLNQYATYANRWSPTNPSTTIPVVGGVPEGYYSTRELEDASYLRLKTVELAYSIPANYLKKIGLKDIVLTASAQNLVTWTRYTGMDPEVSTRNSILTPGFDYSAFPIAKTLVFGLKASL